MYSHFCPHSAHRVAAKVAPVVRCAALVARPFACRPPKQKGTFAPKNLNIPLRPHAGARGDEAGCFQRFLGAAAPFLTSLNLPYPPRPFPSGKGSKGAPGAGCFFASQTEPGTGRARVVAPGGHQSLRIALCASPGCGRVHAPRAVRMTDEGRRTAMLDWATVQQIWRQPREDAASKAVNAALDEFFQSAQKPEPPTERGNV